MKNLLDDIEKVVGSVVIDQLKQLAQPLKGIKWVHVNSTAEGGGVAEILNTMIPLANALGIETRWEVLKGNADFFKCTKLFHNGLQGNTVSIPSSLLETFEAVNKANAEEMHEKLKDADVVIIHDPQPLPFIEHFPERKNKWLWRCHIDASKPYRPLWKYLRKFANQYDASIFSLVDFAQPLQHPMFLIPPSIDPLSEKNIELPPEEVLEVRKSFGIDPNHPMILQVSRFDRFKDPVGVIESYRLAKKFQPDLELVLAGGGASDDPEGEAVLNEVRTAALGDPHIHVLLLPSNAHRTINALQRSADIVIQKSVREGFGLTVTEGLWKGKAVIGGDVGGIRLQVINHHTGFLVNTPEGAAHRIRYLLQNSHKREEMGAKGHEFVKQNFLITRHLQEYLTLILSLFFDSDIIQINKLTKLK